MRNTAPSRSTVVTLAAKRRHESWVITMGREVRRVPATWEHPKDERGKEIPLHDGYNKRLADWDERNAKWAEGLRDDWKGGWKSLDADERNMSFVEWDGERPQQDEYMPDWPEAERTHFQMYETCTEGTPISPVMETPELLARWLADNGASSFGNQTATYEQWLGMIGEGWAMSAVMIGGEMRSGVAAIGNPAFKREHEWPDVIE